MFPTFLLPPQNNASEKQFCWLLKINDKKFEQLQTSLSSHLLLAVSGISALSSFAYSLLPVCGNLLSSCIKVRHLAIIVFHYHSYRLICGLFEGGY